MKRKPRGPDEKHAFGGRWTSAKLEVVAKYLCAYTRVLRGTTFLKGYIDAFAGTGYREPSRNTSAGDRELPFPDLAEEEPQALLDGSARLALKTEPRFDRYVFIEQSSKRCAELEKLRDEFPALANDIKIFNGEANEVIQDLCSRDWTHHRAVLFLDPYGMQVDWLTINERLKSVFAEVAEEPRVLRNSRNSPLYLLCFATGNKKGASIALKIANHLLKRGTT